MNFGVDKKEDTIPCKICSELTHMLGTKLCNSCWSLESRASNLIQRNPTAAVELFERLLKEAEKAKSAGG